jgi:septation ring formation regulator EzrA
MADPASALDKGEAALQALYQLLNAEMNAGDAAAQKTLQDQIEVLDYRLTQLDTALINADQARIDALGAGLDAVAQQANAGLQTLSNLAPLLQSLNAAVKLADGILQAVALG